MVGDLVFIARKADNYENGWKNEWVDEMDEFIGNFHTITADNNCAGFFMREYNFPYFVLSKGAVKKTEDILKDWV